MKDTFWNPDKSLLLNFFVHSYYFMILKQDKNSYFILSMMYLSGIRPSWPLTDPFHQSFDTCLVRETVSPLWKLTSLVDLAVKSYNAWASKVSDSEEESRGKIIRFQRLLVKLLYLKLLPITDIDICRSCLCLIIWFGGTRKSLSEVKNNFHFPKKQVIRCKQDLYQYQ